MNNNTLNQKSPLGDLGVKIRSTKVMIPTNTIGSTQGQAFQFRMASFLAVTFSYFLIPYYQTCN